MSVVLKEHEWASEMIKEKCLGKKPSETLQRVARYYLDEGYSASETRNMLDIFLLQCDSLASIPKWSLTLDRAVKHARKHRAICIDSIKVTRAEMRRIEALEGKQIKRLAFTLLCLSKYWMAVNEKCDGWVSNQDNEIMAMANIKTSVKRQSFMYSVLRDEGMLQFSKRVDNTNVRVLFAEEGETALEITDFRNLGYQYLMYVGEPYFECQNCGLVTRYSNPSSGRRQKYCKSCAVEVNIKNSVSRAMVSPINIEKTISFSQSGTPLEK